jgi:hypothetical protein
VPLPRGATCLAPSSAESDHGPLGTTVSVMAADVVITHYTDPACPWAFSAEPFRLRLEWLYGDAIRWETRMVGLSDNVAEMEAKGFTPEKLAGFTPFFVDQFHMPIDPTPGERLAVSVPACKAVVAAKVHAPEHADALLRALRVRNFDGQLLDAPETIDGAARDAGIDPADLDRWVAEDEVEAALREDMAEARNPIAAARVLDDRLANWSGGRRYTCPSYEIVRASDGVRIAVPGFQPFEVYDVVTANLVPGLERRDPPEEVEDVLRWCGTPLATKEVAVVCDIPFAQARERLGRVADERHVGADGFWSLDAASPAGA